MLWCGLKNIFQKDKCLKTIILCVENMIIILGFMGQHDFFFLGGGAIWPFNEHENLHLDNE